MYFTQVSFIFPNSCYIKNSTLGLFSFGILHKLRFAGTCSLLYFRFRKQHEQLRAVILRVLRPSAAKTPHSDAKKENGNISEHHIIDMSDANAGQEVDLAYENFKEIDPLDITKDGIEAWETAQKRYGNFQVDLFCYFLLNLLPK